MKKVLLPILGACVGLGSGIFLHYGYTILASRPGAPGGEVLIPALLLGLVIFGVALGRMTFPVDAEWHPLGPDESVGVSGSYMDGYIEGYEDGYNHGMVDANDPL